MEKQIKSIIGISFNAKLSKKGKKGVSFLVAKILISVFKSNDYDFIKDKAIVHYRDHNSGNISLENIFIELK